jgi:hypothetical protein
MSIQHFLPIASTFAHLCGGTDSTQAISEERNREVVVILPGSIIKTPGQKPFALSRQQTIWHARPAAKLK